MKSNSVTSSGHPCGCAQPCDVTESMRSEPLTVKLNNGATVLAKLYMGEPSALHFSNRTQAQRRADLAGKGWQVRQFGRPFYVMKLEPELVPEHYAHDKCPKCGKASLPAEGVPDQALRGCHCGEVWTENLDAPVAITPAAAAVQPIKPELEDEPEIIPHLFSPHTNVCVRCGQSAEDDAIENTSCDPGAVAVARILDGANRLREERDQLRLALAGLMKHFVGDRTAKNCLGGSGEAADFARAVLAGNPEPLQVIVEVTGGVAYVEKCPPGVSVEIIDHDNEKHS